MLMRLRRVFMRLGGLPQSTLIVLLVGIIVLVSVSIIFTPLIPCAYTVLVGEREIQSTVDDLIADTTDPGVKIRRIMDWEVSNMINMYTAESNFISGLPVIWHRNSENPSWVFFYKRGNCGEYATLFVKMAEIAGLEARKVYNYAEDHVWAEVGIGEEWMSVDSSVNMYINPENFENERGIQMSYVYTIEGGELVDITSRYTETGTLVIRATEDNVPVPGAEVTIKSKSLMGHSNRYPGARSIVPSGLTSFTTGTDGSFTLDLGNNDYDIVVEYGGETINNPVTIEGGVETILQCDFSR